MSAQGIRTVLRRLLIPAPGLLALLSCLTYTPLERQALAPGMIIPLYVYPFGDADPDRYDPSGVRAAYGVDDVYAAVARIAKSVPTVTVVAVVNPDNGPGTTRDPNYQAATDRLVSAGVVVIGYVPLTFGKRPLAEVKRDLNRWRFNYTGVSGVFYDEVPVADAPSDPHPVRRYLVSVAQSARELGAELLVGNPGRGVPRDYFAQDLFDIVVLYENVGWPQADSALLSTARQKTLAARSAALIYGDGVWDREAFTALANRIGFVYVDDHRLDTTEAGTYAWSHFPNNLLEQARILAQSSGPTIDLN